MNEDKLKRFVIKLIALTQEEKLTWDFNNANNGHNVFDPTPYLGDGEVIGCLYMGQLMDRNLILYQYRTKRDWSWNEPEFALHMVRLRQLSDNNYVSYFQFPEAVHLALEDLYTVVQEQTLTKDSFIDEVLNIH